MFFLSRNSRLNAHRLNVARRYTFPLREGHKTAFLCTETVKYRYVEELDTPKKWFKENIKGILALYGENHRVQKEDLNLSESPTSLIVFTLVNYEPIQLSVPWMRQNMHYLSVIDIRMGRYAFVKFADSAEPNA